MRLRHLFQPSLRRSTVLSFALLFGVTIESSALAGLPNFRPPKEENDTLSYDEFVKIRNSIVRWFVQAKVTGEPKKFLIEVVNKSESEKSLLQSLVAEAILNYENMPYDSEVEVTDGIISELRKVNLEPTRVEEVRYGSLSEEIIVLKERIELERQARSREQNEYRRERESMALKLSNYEVKVQDLTARVRGMQEESEGLREKLQSQDVQLAMAQARIKEVLAQARASTPPPAAVQVATPTLPTAPKPEAVSVCNSPPRCRCSCERPRRRVGVLARMANNIRARRARCR